MSEEKTPLEQAIEIKGSQKALGESIGTTQQSVHKWLKKDGLIPLEFCKAVERETGIPRHVQRPDHFDPPAKPAVFAKPEMAASPG